MGLRLQGYEITVEEVEEDEKVCLSAWFPSTCVGTQILGFRAGMAQCKCPCWN